MSQPTHIHMRLIITVSDVSEHKLTEHTDLEEDSKTTNKNIFFIFTVLY